MIGNLNDYFGDEISSMTAKQTEDKFGFVLSAGYQKTVGNDFVSIFKLTNIEKVSTIATENGMEILTKEQANAYISTNFKSFSVKNEALMNANLTKKINDESIDIEEMLPNWTTEQELEFLYNNGISGIMKRSWELID